MGPDDPIEAKKIGVAKPSLRAAYGTTIVRNAIYGSATELCALRDKEIFFKKSVPSMERVLAVLKPPHLSYTDAISVMFEVRARFISWATNNRLN
jgi:hypothetical protein